MMRHSLWGLVSLFVFLFSACSEVPVDTFGNIAGTVSDAQSGALLAGVTVSLSPTGYSQVTGNDGAFQFDNLDVQEYTLTFKRVGYESTQHKVTVKPGLSSSVQITMMVADVSRPTVVMSNITNLGPNSARLHANLTSIGNSAVTQHGFCFAEHSLPTVADNVVNLGAITAPGAFSSDILDLQPGHTYYCRAFAQNGAGQAFSDELTFNTPEAGTPSGQGNGNSIVVPQGLIFYYTFDDETANDQSEIGIDARPEGNPSFIEDGPGGSGKAIFLNGMKEQFLEINRNIFSGMTHWSVAFWIKDFSAGSLITGVAPGEIYASYLTPVFYFESDGHFSERVGITGNRTSFSTTYTSLQSSEWHHVVWTCAKDGNASISTHNLFVDGQLVDNTSSSFVMYDRVKKVQIGGNADGLYPLFLTAKLDNFRLYGRALVAADVKELYDAKK